jgi:hypothetical protein
MISIGWGKKKEVHSSLTFEHIKKRLAQMDPPKRNDFSKTSLSLAQLLTGLDREECPELYDTLILAHKQSSKLSVFDQLKG